eukprot:TRINITY_DN10425_c0_g1_i1.p1 TRINITY_DN10425_c0_g1~~TRINITY_DN10425_c0_g1_i1.p1  ORF type:complete len:462 (-),score=104.63 TRINITY_DN10425_c0_g1_i1:601-1986(-)
MSGRVVVVGHNICSLLLALYLARDGQQVVVLGASSEEPLTHTGLLCGLPLRLLLNDLDLWYSLQEHVVYARSVRRVNAFGQTDLQQHMNAYPDEDRVFTITRGLLYQHIRNAISKRPNCQLLEHLRMVQIVAGRCDSERQDFQPAVLKVQSFIATQSAATLQHFEADVVFAVDGVDSVVRACLSPHIRMFEKQLNCVLIGGIVVSQDTVPVARRFALPSVVDDDDVCDPTVPFHNVTDHSIDNARSDVEIFRYSSAELTVLPLLRNTAAFTAVVASDALNLDASDWLLKLYQLTPALSALMTQFRVIQQAPVVQTVTDVRAQPMYGNVVMLGEALWGNAAPHTMLFNAQCLDVLTLLTRLRNAVSLELAVRRFYAERLAHWNDLKRLLEAQLHDSFTAPLLERWVLGSLAGAVKNLLRRSGRTELVVLLGYDTSVCKRELHDTTTPFPMHLPSLSAVRARL